jgi:mannosyltransferase
VGTSEAAVRSLSALLGVVLVAVTYALGRLVAGRWAGLAAAVFAAVHPFQVYYSQEARMYMLLAVLTAGAMVAVVHLAGRDSIRALAAVVVLEAAGLYTHYSFAFVALTLNLGYGLWLGLSWKGEGGGRRILNWGLAQAAVVVLYLPWLPTALRQVTSWPGPEQTTAFLPAVANTWRWLILGPTIEIGQTALALPVAALLTAVGAYSLGVVRAGYPALREGMAAETRPARWAASLLVLWVGVPVALMFALGLYREAYLKFLLVTTPAITLLLASSMSLPSPAITADTHRATRRAFYALRFVIYAAVVLLPSNLALHNYYSDGAYARDDYRSIAAYVAATGRPGDAVVLNAPGQQEVFGYYYRGELPVYPLPESRPPEPEATEAALAQLARPGGRVFAVLWATDESDPARVVEGWLDSHTYKALDSWYGNVRLAVYAVPERTPDAPDQRLDVALRNAETGEQVTLVGYSLLGSRLAAGDIAQITLFWQAERTPAQRYKVFVHVLDGNNQIAGQRDAEPGGGARLTTLWQPGEMVADNYGVAIHPATPPGEYRVEVGMYGLETGQRLVTADGESQVWLEPLTVARPAAPAPVDALGMEHAGGAPFGALTLLGYDAYKLGYAHQAGAQLRPGDTLYTGLYWRAASQPGGDWRVGIALVDAKGEQWAALDAEPVGGYATSLWQAGDVWRGQFNLAIPGNAPAGKYRLQVQPTAPDGARPEPFLSEPMEIGP